MDFVNQSGLVADWTHGLQVDGRERVVVIVKGTYSIPERADFAPLAEEQQPLIEADEYWGEPGLTAPKLESDYAHFKPRCDVLVNGSAHAPGSGRRKVRVSLRVGPVAKSFDVTGDRSWWRVPLLGARPGMPKRFREMPLTYDRAFGGTDSSRGDKKIRSYLANPVGRGFRRYVKGIGGEPLPNTEEPGKRIRSPRRRYKPMGLGPIGRNWQPRVGFAGTYDEEWLEKRVPLLPRDFDDRYFQAAPPDQQMPYPRGGELIDLENLSPRGRLTFRLPRDLYMPVLFVRTDGDETTMEANVDTMLLEPDAARLSLTWRAVFPLRRNAFELYEVIAGPLTPAQRRERLTEGKTHYASLSDLVARRSANA